jgi:aspartate aminotransferase
LISKQIRELMESGSAIRKMWDYGRKLKAQHGEDQVADMTLGNPVAPPPAALMQALADVVADPPAGLHRYTAHAGRQEVRERIALHLNERALLPGVGADQILVTAGASAASNIMLRAVLDPGDEVIFLAPYFPDYPAHVLNNGGHPISVPTQPDFLPDLEQLDRAMGRRTRVVIVNHPNNPSGRLYPKSLLEQLAAVLRDRSRLNGRPVYLLSDEPYRELRFTEEPFISPAQVYEHGIMAYSFSKSHSIPGERIGYLAVNPDGEGQAQLVAAMSLASRILGFPNAPSLWQEVISRCLDALVDIAPLKRDILRLYDALRQKGYDVVKPDGTFYLFPRIPIADEEAFLRGLMENFLLVVPGYSFGSPGYFRLALCVDEKTVDLAIDLLPPAAGG